MASGRAQLVVRDGASAFHHLLQPTASAMETDLDGGESHSQEVGDFGSGKGVGLVQQNYSAVLIGQKIQTPLNACAGLFPLRNVEGRGSRRNRQLKAIFPFLTVEGNQRLGASDRGTRVWRCGTASRERPLDRVTSLHIGRHGETYPASGLRLRRGFLPGRGRSGRFDRGKSRTARPRQRFRSPEPYHQ